MKASVAKMQPSMQPMEIHLLSNSVISLQTLFAYQLLPTDTPIEFRTVPTRSDSPRVRKSGGTPLSSSRTETTRIRRPCKLLFMSPRRKIDRKENKYGLFIYYIKIIKNTIRNLIPYLFSLHNSWIYDISIIIYLFPMDTAIDLWSKPRIK